MWTLGPTADSLAMPAAGEVHLWQVALADVPEDDDAVSATLTVSERERAARFAFPHLTRRWTRGRIALRRILAAYLRVPAAGLAFGAGPRGKPFVLADGGKPSRLAFNMSDAGEYVLVAVGLDQAIGVDIEAIRPIAEIDDLVERNFSVIERAAYRRLAPERRLLGFFTGWTRKEAYTKAVGLGLYLPLGSFSVTLDPGEPARLVEIDGDPRKAAEWTLLGVAAPDGHVGAVVARGPVSALRAWTWRAGESL